jgi:hypothetical protein
MIGRFSTSLYVGSNIEYLLVFSISGVTWRGKQKHEVPNNMYPYGRPEARQIGVYHHLFRAQHIGPGLDENSSGRIILPSSVLAELCISE